MLYLIRFFLLRFMKDKKILFSMFLIGDVINYLSRPEDSLVTSFFILSFFPFVLSANYLSDPFDKGILDIFIIKFGRKTYYVSLAISIFFVIFYYLLFSGILRFIYVSSAQIVHSDNVFFLIHYQYLVSVIYIIGLAMFYGSVLKQNYPLILYILGQILLIAWLATYGLLFNPEISPLLNLKIQNIYLIIISPTIWLDYNNAFNYYLILFGIGIVLFLTGLKIFQNRERS